MLAQMAGQYLNIEPPARSEIRVNVLGINHFTWVDRAYYQGHDLFDLLHHHLKQPGTLRPYTQAEVESWNDWFHSADQVKFALFQRFGILAAAGDRHLVEFLPGFIHSPENLFKWGLIRTPVSCGRPPGRGCAAYQSTHCQSGVDHRSGADRKHRSGLPGILQ